MDRRVEKLRILGVAEEVAEALVAQGLDTPKKIKAAKAADLKVSKADKDDRVKKMRTK